MAEHTPGPWGWEFFKRGGLLMRYPLALSGEGRLSDVLVASTDEMGTVIIRVEPANARLIAAAPVMAEQLRRDVERFRDFAKFARESGWSNLAAEFELFAAEGSKTLLKATGATP